MNIYHYESYKTYLQELLTQSRGLKTQLATYLNCQSSFLSQVLTGDKTHFSLEHIKKIAEFLTLDKDELDFLILLCLHERAGSNELKKHFESKITEQRELHQQINKKISKRGQGLTLDQQATYYSHWSYMAVHMLISIPSLATTEKIKNHFNLAPHFIDEILQFLLECDLIEKHGHRYSIGKTRLHLGKNSPFVKSLHQNWRHKAIESLAESDDGFDLHYSSVLVLSKKDAEKIKDLILEFIRKKEEILAPSPEEQAVALSLDYYKL